ncbi:MAG: DUF885 domain-containing protein [Lachnospiraceae bacterium]|nr:DUF885 domain-containing protein [Lachnospiraceae bacterium]
MNKNIKTYINNIFNNLRSTITKYIYKAPFKIIYLGAFISLIIVLTTIMSLINGPKKNTKGPNIPFNEFSNQLFVDIVSTDGITLNFTLDNPSKYGIKDFPTTFGNIPLTSEDTSFSNADNILTTLSHYNYEKLSLSEQYAFDTISWHYNNILESKDYIYYDEYLSPTDGIHIQLPILLSEFHFNSTADIENYLQLLPDIERYFNDICEFEKLKYSHGLFMSQSSCNKVIEQCKNMISTLNTSIFITAFNNNIESVDDITRNEIYEYEKQNLEIVHNQVKNAYHNLYVTLSTLNSNNTNSGRMFKYPYGKEYYSLNIDKCTGSNRSIKNIISILENTIVLNNSRLLSLISKNKDIKRIDLTTNYGISETHEIIATLQDKMSRYFPDIKNVDYTIKSVPDELTSYLNPAFYIVSPLDNYKKNTIYINSVAEYSGNPLFTNIAHESFPGHLYQNAYFCQNNTLPIRNVLKNNGYIEGWASYITNLSYGYTEMDAAQVELSKCNDAIVLCLSARADIGVHYEGWTRTDISNYFSENNCTLDNKTICTLYDIIIDDPGDYLSYAVGYIEITRLLEEAKENMQDNFSLKKFHTFLLNAGPTPFNSIKSHIKEELYK